MDDKVERYLQHMEQDQLDALGRKFPREHFLAAIKIALEAVPGVGGALSALIDEYGPDRQRDRLISFVEGLARRIGRLERQVKTERIRPEEFGDLLFDTLRLVSRDHREEKTSAYRAILLNALITSDTVVGESEFFMTLVRDLSVPHIQMLRVLYRPEASIPQSVLFQGPGVEYTTTVRGVLHRVFGEAPEGYVDAIWTGLSAQGLVNDSVYRSEHKFIKAAPSRQGMADHRKQILDHLASSALTPWGRRFVRFITEPAGADMAETEN